MSETLAEKTCTPCRGGIPPLTGDEAQRFQAQAPNVTVFLSTKKIKGLHENDFIMASKIDRVFDLSGRSLDR
jgi:4a-hydroxytetrahydrobiopterin dehydratase